MKDITANRKFYSCMQKGHTSVGHTMLLIKVFVFSNNTVMTGKTIYHHYQTVTCRLFHYYLISMNDNDTVAAHNDPFSSTVESYGSEN
jgi:hypothetical protein